MTGPAVMPGLFGQCPPHVRIVEVGPRDGLQNEARHVPATAKIAFVNALSATGHSHIEVTAFVSPRKVPQMADAGEVFRGITKRKGVTYTALVPNDEGLRRALEAGARSIAVFTAASETFSQKNIGCSIADSLERIRSVLAGALKAHLRVRGYVSTAFVCPYEGRIEPAKALEVVARLRDAGIREISIGDTLGAAYPDQVNRLLEAIGARFGIADFALHLHDTYGRALANALVGLLHGVEELDASAGGLGGCPFAPGARGNLSTEALVDFLEGMGIETGIDAEKLKEAAALVKGALPSTSTPTPG